MEIKRERLKNDRKAPRFGKKEFVHHVISKEFFKNWLKENPKYSHFTYRVFLNHWDMITQEIHNEILMNPQGVRLPYYNGDMLLSYIHTNKEIINPGVSDKIGKDIKFLNWNTDKKPGKVCWIIDHARKRNKWLKLFGGHIDRKLRIKAFNAFQTHPEIFKTARITHANAVMFDKKKKEKNAR